MKKMFKYLVLGAVNLACIVLALFVFYTMYTMEFGAIACVIGCYVTYFGLAWLVFENLDEEVVEMLISEEED